MTLVIGVGIDLVEIARFGLVLDRRSRLGDRLFTDAERAYAAEATDPVQRLAARFAAKEATLKALGRGLGAARFREIEVVRAGSGAPSLALHGGAAELAASLGVRTWQLSLTHTDSTAGAVVVALA